MNTQVASSILSAESNNILDMDATAIADAVKSRKLTSHEVVTTYIEHCKEVNPAINAMVEDRFTEAINEASEKDNQTNENSDEGPLYGVPISIKESLDVADMKTTGGLVHRLDFIARTDADVINKLKQAGAIILGKTNTPALCFCQETENKLYGRTNNPWDITRTAGGSSGGEGALLAAGGAAAGIGSDIGGSIRFPSHFNGVVGFKPGKNQVSAAGHFPPSEIAIQDRMLGVGPMGKSVRDSRLLYSIITDKPIPKRSLSKMNIDILPGQIGYPLSDVTKSALDQIEQFLSSSFSTHRTAPPYLEDSAQLWQEIMSFDGGDSVKALAFNSDKGNVLTSYAKARLTRRTAIHPYLSWALIGAKMFKPSKDRKRKIEAILQQGDEQLEDYLSDRLLVFPVYHSGAPQHGKVYQEIFSIRKTFLQYMPYVAYANVWGLPSLTIPVRTDENDMPISIQVMSVNGNESAIFQLGEILERRFRGYVRR